MEIICLKVGAMGTNCYLVTDESSSQTLIVDPGDEADFITSSVLEHKLKPIAIILTHGHYDHCLGALELKLNFNIPIYLHPKDVFLYDKAHISAKHFSGFNVPKLPPVDHFLTDNEIINLGDSSIKIIHTPGHTPGSICLYSAPNLFTGDTLFNEGVGRTDLSYSSRPDLQKSLEKIYSLPKSTLVFPGHEDFRVPLTAPYL